MIRHNHLCSVRDHQLRCRYVAVCDRLELADYLRDVECDTVSDNICDMAVEYAGRQCVQCKLAIIVHNGVSCICSALKTDDDVSLIREHICDLAFSLIAPVSAYYCCNHMFFLLI